MTMTGTLLQTKLFAPQVRRDAIVRSRLQEVLASGQGCKLTLVSAPAGFGKTTAVAAWVARHSRAAWLSLDAGDNDLRRFLTYLVAALQTVEDRFVEELRQLLNTPHLPDAETLVALLTKEMHDSEPFLLVLDDYQAVDNPAIHELVETLLAYQPLPLHLILVTREDPPLPLTRLRGRGALNEIRTRDLRFTEAEAHAFLNEAMGLTLTNEQIHTLETRTEGWIAGLQLAALSLQNTPHRTSFVDAFAGDDRYVLDYLMDEVFARQPERDQQFLLRTSILGRLTAPLCAMVVGLDGLSEADAQSLLEQLETSNLFIVPLDNRRQWYRYHHLFADLLRYRLMREMPERVPALQQRASIWYEENGHLREAVEHARAGGDDQRVAQLIEAHAATFFAASEMKTVLDWVEALPPDLVEHRPALLMIQAWAALSTGYPERTTQSLDRIESHLGAGVEALAVAEPESDEEIRGALAEVAVTRAVVAYGRGDAAQAVALTRRALPGLTEDAVTLFHRPLTLRGVAFHTLGVANQMKGDVNTAGDAFRKAIAISRAQGNSHIVTLATGFLGQNYVLQGQLHRAERLYRETLTEAETAGDGQTPYRSVAHAGLGTLFYEWDDLDAAREHLDRAISLGRPLGHWESLIPAYTGRATLAQAQGDGGEALTALDELVGLRRRFGAPERMPEVEALRATLHLRQGNRTAAIRWAGRGTWGRPAGETVATRDAVGMAQARVLIAQERIDEALKLLDRLLAQAQGDGRDGSVVPLLALQALALDVAGRRDRAVDTVGRALILARPGEYVRTFVDEGQPMAPLLYAAAEQGVAPEYAGRLLSSFEATVGHPVHPPADVEELVEPLTEREMEVLQLVAEGLTNREIAQALSIALGTVKVHTYNIYGKLNVNNRTEAVARSRMLGVLPFAGP